MKQSLNDHVGDPHSGFVQDPVTMNIRSVPSSGSALYHAVLYFAVYSFAVHSAVQHAVHHAVLCNDV